MQFRIDTTELTFLVSTPAKAVTKFGTEEVKLRDGQPLYSVELIAMGDDGADKIKVKVLGKPELSLRAEVKVTGLLAFPWEQNGKSGIAFSADRIEPASKPIAKAS